MLISNLASLCFFLWIANANSYKILIYVPGISNSQLLFNYRLGDLLASRGHDVTLFVAHLHKIDPKREPKFAKAIHYVASTKFQKLKDQMDDQIFQDDNPMENIPKMIGIFRQWFGLFQEACEKQISDKELMAKLGNEKFDLAIGHMYDACPLGMFRALNISSYIWMSSGILLDYMAWYSGVPTIPSYVPNGLSSFGDKMTLAERFKNLLGLSIFLVMHRILTVNPYTTLFQKHFGPDFPPIHELMAKAPLVFVNSEELLDFPRPMLHKVIYIGGIEASTPEPLTDEWKQVVEKSNKGVILFSLGSVVNTKNMPLSWKRAFLDGFARFPEYTFVWKFDGPFPEAESVKNVKITSWAPQKDLLAHPKAKAFITHCGFNSFLESVSNGVPMLALPFFGDQMGNFKRAERHGVAVGLKKTELSADLVYEKLNELLTNTNYSTNVKRLASMLKKKPVKAADLAVGWIEFLAEHKEIPNLQPVSADMGYIEYFLLDVALILLLGIVVFLFITWVIARCIFNRCRGRGSSRKRTKSKAE